MYVLPSLFTAINIGAGYYAITQSLQGSTLEPHHFDFAAIAILLAIPFDALDGRIARITNTTSEFGKELDSLADVVTFGVAPSVLAYTWGFRMLSLTMDHLLRQKLVELGGFVCFLFLLCGASRLARFNISTDAQPKNPGRPDRKYFVGMPIPAAAGVIASMVHMLTGTPVFNGWFAIAWMTVVGLCGFLMVSTWRFWSGKEITLRGRHPFRMIVLLGLMLYALVNFSSYILPAGFCAYLFSGVAARAAYSAQRRRKRRLGLDDLRSDGLKANQVRFDSPEHHDDGELPIPRPASDDEKIVTTTATHSATHSHDAPSHP
jgi:CDP-diacylglycerol--serine O-phosphatidyltransferase